jgi:hypothetical protein
MECIALKGKPAAAGLVALPLGAGFPRADEALLCAPVADDARVDELAATLAVGTWTIPRQTGVGREERGAWEGVKFGGYSQIEAD